jgi:hypothetical protein
MSCPERAAPRRIGSRCRRGDARGRNVASEGAARPGERGGGVARWQGREGSLFCRRAGGKGQRKRRTIGVDAAQKLLLELHLVKGVDDVDALGRLEVSLLGLEPLIALILLWRHGVPRCPLFCWTEVTEA